MKEKVKQGLEKIIPFLILGVAIAFLLGVFIVFSYILFWGIIVGVVIWSINALKNLIPPTKNIDLSDEETKGRIIEQDERE
ncbi:MAG: hypothetical protein H0U57_00565 [Tatlockia sp.]|nr:hypothetical protein [Tatlockia sp.]